MSSLFRYLLLSAAFFSSLYAQATPFNVLDARAASMGGTGVASATGGNAMNFNPALIHLDSDSGKVKAVLPVLGASVSDAGDLVDAIDDTEEETLETFNRAVTIFNQSGSPTLAEVQEIAESAGQLYRQLVDINEDTVNGQFGGGIGFAAPSDGFTLGFTSTYNTYLAVGPRFSTNDLALLNLMSQLIVADFQVDGVIDNPGFLKTSGEVKDENDLTSSFNAVAVGLLEFGVTYATKVDMGGNELFIGLTPKIQSITAWDYQPTINSSANGGFESDDIYDSEEDDTVFNLDFGIAHQFGENREWVLGLTLKNLLGTDIKTEPVTGARIPNKVEINTQARLGLARRSGKINFAFDLDAVDNDAVAFGNDTQFFSAGVEFLPIDSLALRTGFRTNLSSGSDINDAVSIGAGFGKVVDLAFVGSGDEVGAVLQANLQF